MMTSNLPFKLRPVRKEPQLPRSDYVAIIRLSFDGPGSIRSSLEASAFKPNGFKHTGTGVWSRLGCDEETMKKTMCALWGVLSEHGQGGKVDHIAITYEKISPAIYRNYIRSLEKKAVEK